MGEERSKELEKENNALKQKIKELEAEIQQLKEV